MLNPVIDEVKLRRRPSWESRNEGVHERVNFDDTIWGFDLAGGAYYETPLRVKKDSRAQLAGIRPGDQLIRINDIDTSTLTLEEAHELILDSGIHIKLAVTSPDDEETTYNVWEDPLEEEVVEEKLKPAPQVKKEVKPFKGVVTNSHWSLQWPWVSKRRVIYKESNCFLVPSTYEIKHPDKLLPKIADKENNLVLNRQ